ncbi:MAG TPA: ACT domain-containing protein [Nocardioides sp.]|nr:ACT domain-containing protein [Nocardioides sp.]
MALFVMTVFGDDRPGVISAISGPITRLGGNWERSQLARLAGKFAGIVEASVPDERYAALVAELTALEDLHVTIEGEDLPESEAAEGEGFLLELLGNDHPGIVAEVSAVLAEHGVSIEELVTEVRDAPMAGGHLFEARAVLVAPPAGTDALRAALEGLADELMVDLTLTGP